MIKRLKVRIVPPSPPPPVRNKGMDLQWETFIDDQWNCVWE